VIAWCAPECNASPSAATLIVAVDGNKVASPFDLNILLNRKRPGDTVTLTVYRGGKKMDLPVKLAERPGS